jgi:hypothetical protein
MSFYHYENLILTGVCFVYLALQVLFLRMNVTENLEEDHIPKLYFLAICQVVAFTKKGDRLVGQIAKRQVIDEKTSLFECAVVS